jgi:DNA-binding IscR family transcriptional regulator
MLGRPANTISVADVIEGHRRPVHRHRVFNGEARLRTVQQVQHRDPLWQIRERIAAALGIVTIAEIAAENVSPVSVSHAAVLHNART